MTCSAAAALQLVPDNPVYSIAGPSDLAQFPVATATAAAATVLEEQVPVPEPTTLEPNAYTLNPKPKTLDTGP